MVAKGFTFIMENDFSVLGLCVGQWKFIIKYAIISLKGLMVDFL